jgi:hypothetical protein
MHHPAFRSVAEEAVHEARYSIRARRDILHAWSALALQSVASTQYTVSPLMHIVYHSMCMSCVLSVPGIHEWLLELGMSYRARPLSFVL